MTTYPLSEAATIYPGETLDVASSEPIGQGTLEDCADIVAGLPTETQQSVVIRMNDLDMTFGPQDILELLGFLREETPGLSDNDITEIKTTSS